MPTNLSIPSLMPERIKPICILDDDLSVLNSLRELLDSDGFDARMFDSSDLFLAYVREHTVGVVILDVLMPGMDGIEVQQRLRELSPDTRVVIMTGCEEAHICPAALKGGVFAFLVKPFDDELFLTLVRSAVGTVAGS
jgi:two-component system, LuxR family, response regulator FixJ